MSRRPAAMVLAAIAVILSSAAAVHAYLKIGANAGGRVVPILWTHQPVRYFITNRDVPNVTAAQLQTAVAGAFATWAGVDTAAVSSSFTGFTTADPFVDDGLTVIGFRSRPDLDRTLGATTFTTDAVTGELLQADIFLNSAFQWSVAAGGESSRYDVQSIATHEIGHLFGLGHSALGETELAAGSRRVLAKSAVMFPLAYPAGNVRDRILEPDDVAGISDLYGTPAFDTSTGSISGRVRLNGNGVFGAHVVAFNTATAVMIGSFSLTAQGDFVLAGLAPGVYLIRAEPLDDADIDGFFDSSQFVNTNFKVGYAPRLVSVPAGGSGASVDIAVTAK